MGLFNEKLLFMNNMKLFRNVEKNAKAFSKKYIGDTIVRDAIFSVAENYVLAKGVPFELLRFPIEDEELCAFTFIRNRRIFVVINSHIYLAKQIFAMAHELFHIRCFLEEDNLELEQKGSILNSSTIDAGTTEEEEMEANAFAGLLLVPDKLLKQQITIYNIDSQFIGTDSVLTLMDIFAVPYKAMVFRLYEYNFIKIEDVMRLLEVPKEEVKSRIQLTGKARQWDRIPIGCEKLGTLNENLTANEQEETLPQSRLESDRKRLEEIMKKYHIY